MKISLSHVSKYYQDGDKSTRGLEDVSLTFQTDSSFVVITGESGAGKSTLFRVLTGTEDFDEGEITFDDRPLSGVSEEERVRLYRENIAFDFQEYNLIEGFSPIENIVLSLTKSGYGLDEAKKKANQVLDEVGLNKQKRMRVSKLSGGERQRVAIARCLASDAKVLLFDEPTGNLDPSTSKEIIQLIESLQENRLILYITHDFDLVRDKATRHIVLSDGRVVSDEILTTGKPTQEKEETIEKHPTKVKSTLYTSFLFSFKRPARTIITALILLFCSAYLYFGAVGVAAMRDASNGIFNNSVTYVEGHGLGNEVSVNKNKKGNFEPIESDDTVYDNLDLGKDFSVYFAMGEDFDTALANAVAKSVDAMSQYDVSISLNYMPFGPTKTNKTIFQAEKAKDGALPITVYIDQSLGQDSTFLQALENKGFEANSFHLIPRVLYDNYSSVASSGDKPTFIEKMKDNDCLVYLDKIITVDNGDTVFDSIFTFSHEEDRKTYARIINTSLSAFLENSLPFFSSGDTSLQRIVSPEVSLSYEGKYFREDSTIPLSVGETFDDAHFYLSSEFKDKLSLLTFMYNGAVISLEDIPSDEIVFFDSSVRSNPYLYRYSTPTLYTIAKEQHAYGRFYTRDASQADTLATQLSKQENLFVKKIPQKKQITKYGKPTNVVMDISSRISNLFILLATIGGFVLILFLVRLLLSRFYYRKDSDEKVLNDIGYTGKDLYLNNSLQFVFLMVVSVLVCHLVFTFTIPHFIDYYVMHPALFVIAILLSLAVAFFVSMPTRKHKRKERRHD